MVLYTRYECSRRNNMSHLKQRLITEWGPFTILIKSSKAVIDFQGFVNDKVLMARDIFEETLCNFIVCRLET